jgi:mono/diheme cytochrome c family protein
VIPVALLTQALAGWSHGAIQVLALAASVVALLAAWGAVRPARMPRWALALPFVVSVVLIGTFERVREFIRKPYAIAGYLYSNGIRQEDYPLLQRDGLLAHATYTPVREVTKDNAVEAGREVFRLACTRCHTTDGVNGIRGVLEAMYGDQPWDASAISAYVGAMHLARPFMPPFPGNRAERDALGVYLARLQGRRDALEGAQTAGAVSVATPKLP